MATRPPKVKTAAAAPLIGARPADEGVGCGPGGPPHLRATQAFLSMAKAVYDLGDGDGEDSA
jgi:hypothetical protein